MLRNAGTGPRGDAWPAAPFTYGDLTSNPGFVSGECAGDGVRDTFKVTPSKARVTSPITRVRVNAEFFSPSFFSP